MLVHVQFYSFLRQMTGCTEFSQSLQPGSSLADLRQELFSRFPALAPLSKTVLLAVGMEYQPSEHLLQEGDVVAVFPPVQGG